MFSCDLPVNQKKNRHWQFKRLIFETAYQHRTHSFSTQPTNTAYFTRLYANTLTSYDFLWRQEAFAFQLANELKVSNSRVREPCTKNDTRKKKKDLVIKLTILLSQ